MKLSPLLTAAAVLFCVGTASIAQPTYSVGDRVEAYSSMSGRWEKGKITAQDGARYMFKADDSTLANDFWGSPASQLRPIGAAAPPPAAPARSPAAAPVQQQPVAARPQPARPAPAPVQQAQGGCTGGASGAVKIAGAVPAPLGKGRWPNGEPLGTPGQTNFKINAEGRKTIVGVAPPGVGSYLGAFNLMVGGSWSTASIKDLGGGVQERTLNWNVPAQANVLVINADHSWYRKSGSTRYYGRWIDLGQQVVQLVGYDDDDWTGSIQRSPDGTCRMEMRGWLGQNEWGRRL